MDIWIYICFICGAAGLYLWSITLHTLLFKPVKRDHILMRGFMCRVVGLVFSVPFITMTAISLYNCFADSNIGIKDLVYSEDFYNNSPDTVSCYKIPLGGQRKIGTIDSLLLIQTGFCDVHIDNDTLKLGKLRLHNELPEEIHGKQTDPSLLWAMYYHFIDPGNQHMTTSEAGRKLAAILAILGVFLLNGLLITTLINKIDRRKEQWLLGEIRYRPMLFGRFYPLRNFSVLIGGHEMAFSLVKQIIDKNTYLLIMVECDVEEFRSRLFSQLSRRQQQKIVLYNGKRTSGKDIESLYLEKANEVYVLGENPGANDTNSYHDILNMQCIKTVANRMKDKRSSKLTCRVMFEYQTAFSVLQISDLSKEIKNYIDFKPFNFYEMWAQQVLVCPYINNIEKLHENRIIKYLPLEGTTPITANDNDFVHLVIVGMSRMGIALAIEAAHLSHYPNFITRKKRTRITFIDSNAKQEMNFFMGRFESLFAVSRWRFAQTETGNMYHRQFANLFLDEDWNDSLNDMNSTSPYKSESHHLGKDFIDIEWEFIQGSLEEAQVKNYLRSAAMRPDARLTVAVCLPQPNLVVATALYLPDEVYKNSIQILAYQYNGRAVIDSINHNNLFYCKIKPFGMASECYDIKLVAGAEKTAKIFQNAYDTMYNKIHDSLPQYHNNDVDKPRGKTEMAKWWSNIYNANTIWTKLRSVKYEGTGAIEDSKCLLAQTEHNRWNIEQLLMRFRPLTEEEQGNVINQPDGQNKYTQKESYKGDMAHLDICSYERLTQIDSDVKAYDIELTSILPDIYKELK